VRGGRHNSLRLDSKNLADKIEAEEVRIMSLVLGNINGIVALVFGVLILLTPKLLSTLVGIYLIIVGLIGLGIINF